jgi:hypothetical protein
MRVRITIEQDDGTVIDETLTNVRVWTVKEYGLGDALPVISPDSKLCLLGWTWTPIIGEETRKG